jgi:hypothetical protein
MLQSFMMFLAPENPSQATHSSPPAVARPAKSLAQRCNKLRFSAAVLGNTIGFTAILAACWFSIQLMQVLMTPM